MLKLYLCIFSLPICLIKRIKKSSASVHVKLDTFLTSDFLKLSQSSYYVVSYTFKYYCIVRNKVCFSFSGRAAVRNYPSGYVGCDL